MLKVQSAVREVFGPLSPRDDLSLQRFSELTLEVRKKVEGATEAERQSTRWLSYLLPSLEQEDYVLEKSGMMAEGTSGSSASLRRLLDETSDLIDSPPFSHVLTLLLDAGFSTLVDGKVAQQAFKVPPPPSASAPVPKVQEIHDPKPAKLPIVLATLTRAAHQIGNGMPNEYLQAMEQVGDLEAFVAVVYSSNWETEIMPMNEGAKAQGAERKAEDLVVDGAIIGDVTGNAAFESAWGKATENSASDA